VAFIIVANGSQPDSRRSLVRPGISTICEYSGKSARSRRFAFKGVAVGSPDPAADQPEQNLQVLQDSTIARIWSFDWAQHHGAALPALDLGKVSEIQNLAPANLTETSIWHRLEFRRIKQGRVQCVRLHAGGAA
jgi:hypothetical protein